MASSINCFNLCYLIYCLVQLSVSYGKTDLSSKPEILGTSEYILNPGDNFTIICQGSEPLEWTLFPHKDPQLDTSWKHYTKYENYNVKPNNTTFQFASRLFIKNVTYLSIGAYKCHGIKNKNYKNSIYIYIEDEKHLSLYTEPYYITDVECSTIRLPCIPTSPTVTVKLTNLNTDETDDLYKEVEIAWGDTNERHVNSFYRYNNQIGITTNDTSTTGINMFHCYFSLGSITETKTIIVNIENIIVEGELPLPTLKITDNNHIVEGNPLTIQCFFKSGYHIEFKWSTPTGHVNTTRMGFSEYEIVNSGAISQSLTIYSTTMNDSGVYTCTAIPVIQRQHNESDTIAVRIFKKDEHFIKLRENLNLTEIKRQVGKNATWSINIDSHPIAEKLWHGPNNNTITNSSKYTVIYKDNNALIYIDNITIDDYGSYTLDAKNEYVKEKIVLFLNVTAAPQINIKSNALHLIGESSKVTCEIKALPEPTVLMLFQPCLDNTCNNTKIYNITSTKISDTMFTRQASIPAYMSGLVKCIAKNSWGASMANFYYNVSDISEELEIFGFDSGVIYDEENRIAKIAKNENFVAVCAASKYTTSKNVYWYLNNKTLTNVNRINTVSSSTIYSTRTTLNIQSVIMNDGGEYICKVTKKDQSILTKNIYIQVEEATLPTFNNQSNIGQSITVKFPNQLNISCIVSGLPKPKVVWYKNDKVIQSNDERIYIDKEQFLMFKSTESEDEAMYRCAATNKYGTITKTSKLTIENKPFNKLNKYALYAIGFLLVLVFIIFCYLIYKIRNEHKLQRELRKSGLANFEKGDPSLVNPELGICDQAEFLPYNKRWEFPIEKLKLDKQLGSGNFGIVVRGEARRILKNEEVTTVAVKKVKSNVDYSHTKALASELKIMSHLGEHINIVNLLGACTKNVAKRELLVIFEFCRYGNLLNYILRHRASYINQVLENGHIDYNIGAEILQKCYSGSSNGPSSPQSLNYADLAFQQAKSNGSHFVASSVETSNQTGITLLSMLENEDGLSNNSLQVNYQGDYNEKHIKPLCTKDLVAWVFQVARGMEYLCSRKILHGDLAARNILLADNNIVKICDFGLAKSLYNDDFYKKKSDNQLPIKWMAIESIQNRIFSFQSDIWSFGIVLWEFFSLGCTPYPEFASIENLLHKLVNGYRMEPPQYSSKEISNLMFDCWLTRPQSRPSFTKIVERIGAMLEYSVRKHYIDLNDPYLAMNTQRIENGDNDYLAMFSPPDYESLSSPISTTTGYMPMSANLFSPRVKDNSIFNFNVSNKEKNEHVEGTELVPMLRGESDKDCGKSSLVPNSISNPVYHLASIGKPENEIKCLHNYVNMPETKLHLQQENVKHIYVNNLSNLQSSCN